MAVKKTSDASRNLRNRRQQQLEIVNSLVPRLEALQAEVKGGLAKREALENHVKGFYGEIDKLAKGKALIPATDLVVQQANEIIRDAKEIVEGDVYMDRLKEFVPAGDNPVYPDVLIAIRSVVQALDRAEQKMKETADKASSRLVRARTMSIGLEIFLNENDDNIEISIDSVRYYAPNSKVDSTLFTSNRLGQNLLDFYRLDSQDLASALSEGLLETDEEDQA